MSYTKRYKYLLGLVQLKFYCEDRRPDLCTSKAQLQLGYKYKVFITLYVFNRDVLTKVIRTLSIGDII